MLSPVTPSTNSSLIFEVAAARVIASRRSVLKGRLRTIIFWNLRLVRHSSGEGKELSQRMVMVGRDGEALFELRESAKDRYDEDRKDSRR